MSYEQNFRNLLPNGLTLLQVNPDCAVDLNKESKFYAWLFVRGGGGQWVTHRKLEGAELDEAHDQAADMMILHGTKVREG